MRVTTFVSAALATFASVSARAQATKDSVPKGEQLQVVDTTFAQTLLSAPSYRVGTGPVVSVDAGHHNFHTADGRYRPFAKVLAADGFRVRSSGGKADAASLRGTRVLVIANALAARDEAVSKWHLPISAAFDPAEVEAIVHWVRGGGSLLLIADHMPFPGAVAPLADALGAHFADGFALYGSVDPATGDYPIVFRRSDGTLPSNAITAGRQGTRQIDSIETFTGSAFNVSVPGAIPLLVLPRDTHLYLPVASWDFNDSTPQFRGDGMLQGAAFRLGRGRVAVFGEAAMFSAQRKGTTRVPMGFNAPAASQNVPFILNLFHWLVE